MRPIYNVKVNGSDITAILATRLISLRLIDQAGIESDRLELVLDDEGGQIELPATGAVLEVALCYTETGLLPMGKFTADEVELSGPPEKMTIRAQAFDSQASFKVKKSRSFDDITLADLVATIAAENSLAGSRVGPEYIGVTIPHLDQTEESDLHLLTRLANDYGAITKTTGGYLLFVQAGQGKTSSGVALPVASLVPGQVTSYRAILAERGKYSSVKTYYNDLAAAVKVAVVAGTGAPVRTLARVYPTRAEAESAAGAELVRLQRGQAKLELTLPGDPTLGAETQLSITGFREGINGIWSVVEVEHTISAAGYTCRLRAEVPS